MPMSCLLIEDPLSGGLRLSGLCAFLSGRGVWAKRFSYAGVTRLREAMQEQLQALRRCGEASVVAEGAGCGAALALAEQLPVERLVLIEPGWTGRTGEAGGLRAQLARMERFARNNLCLCVSDTLIVGGEGFLNPDRMSPFGRLRCLPGWKNAAAQDFYGLFRFLTAGELPKSLA